MSNVETQDSECRRCALHEHRTQVVLPSPAPPRGLLAIGEAPGEKEDQVGEGFVGVAGKALDKALAAEGMGRADYGRANICRCRPPGNRKPTAVEAQSCLPYLHDMLNGEDVAVVLAVGGTPSSVFYQGRSLGDIIARAAQRNYLPDAEWAQNVLVVPMPHTSPLAWNRKTPDGQPWRDVGMKQVHIAVGLLSK